MSIKSEQYAHSFEIWLAALLGGSTLDIEQILNDKRALRFLIAWSIFEAKCFNGFLKKDMLDGYVTKLVITEVFDHQKVEYAAEHFHKRYQDSVRYRHLMDKQSSPRMSSLLKAPFHTLTPEDKVFIVALSIYRFRNNIFHGNKGITSWLKYGNQIDLCIDAMQCLISHAETITPTLKASN